MSGTWKREAIYLVLLSVVFTAAMPVGFLAILLLASEGSASEAISHGELYIVGGNALFAGITALMSPAAPFRDPRLGLLLTCFGILPCYLLWAIFSVREYLGEDYSESLARDGGIVASVLGVILGAILVAASVREPK